MFRLSPVTGAFTSLALLNSMEFSIKLHTIMSGRSIVYIKVSQVIILKNIFYFFLRKLILSKQTLPAPIECHIQKMVLVACSKVKFIE